MQAVLVYQLVVHCHKNKIKIVLTYDSVTRWQQ
jgi:hypothetical protein